MEALRQIASCLLCEHTDDVAQYDAVHIQPPSAAAMTAVYQYTKAAVEYRLMHRLPKCSPLKNIYMFGFCCSGMHLGRKFLSILSGSYAALRHERAIERSPATQLQDDVDRGEPAPESAQEAVEQVRTAQKSVQTQLNTILRSRDDVMRLYTMLVLFLRERRGTNEDAMLLNEYHRALQRKYSTEWRYQFDPKDPTRGAPGVAVQIPTMSLAELRTRLLDVAAKNRDAMQLIVDAWKLHPIFDRETLRPVRARVVAMHDAWSALHDLAHGLADPYHLKDVERIIEVIVGYRIDLSSRFSIVKVNLEADKPGARDLGVQLTEELKGMRAKIDAAFDALCGQIASLSQNLSHWKTGKRA